MSLELDENCPFCRNVSGCLDSSQIYADDNCVGLKTIEPVNEGHVLIIPRQHYP